MATPVGEKVTSCWNQSRSAGIGALRFAAVSTAMAMKEPFRVSGDMRVGAFAGTVGEF